MSKYIEYPITTDVDQIKRDIYEALEEQFPGWQPDLENSAETWLIEGFAALIADLKLLAVDIPPEIFKQFGLQIMGIAPGLAISASARATIKARDNAGYTLKAGTEVAIQKAGDEPLAFTVLYDVVIAPGDTESELNEAVLRALTPGKEANELTGPAEPISSDVGWIESIILEKATSGGEDEQTGQEYLDKLRDKMQQLSPKLIVKRDFEIEARNTEGIEVAFAEDNYNAETDKEKQGNTITIWNKDSAGQPISAEAKEKLEAAIKLGRTQNFIFFLRDPKYNGVDTKCKFHCLPGYDPDEVEAAVKAALQDYYNPAKWGLSEGDTTIWINKKILRYKEVVAVIDRVAGVDYIDELKIALHGKALEEKDITLEGRVPATEPKDLTIEGEPAT